MKPENLRSFMQRNRVFLHLLYSDTKKNTSNRLTLCTNFQCNVLLHILHNIANGIIPLSSKDAHTIKKTRKVKVLQRIEGGKEFRHLLKSSRDQKVLFLRQFTSLYPLLLKSLFEE